MDNKEMLLYLKSLERMVGDRERAMNAAKEELKKRKDAFDTAVNELRLAVRRDGDDQLDIPFSDHQVLGEDRQLPEHPISPETEAEPSNVLALPPRTDEDEPHPDDEELAS